MSSQKININQCPLSDIEDRCAQGTQDRNDARVINCIKEHVRNRFDKSSNSIFVSYELTYIIMRSVPFCFFPITFFRNSEPLGLFMDLDVYYDNRLSDLQFYFSNKAQRRDLKINSVLFDTHHTAAEIFEIVLED